MLHLGSSFLLKKMKKLIAFSSTLHGFHYYQRYWRSTEYECLDCARENKIPYDYLVIKTCRKTNEKIVGHLLMGISRPTKFLLDRGARITETLTSTSYYASPLIQEVLTMPCLVEMSIPRTIKNKKVISKYEELIEAPH